MVVKMFLFLYVCLVYPVVVSSFSVRVVCVCVFLESAYERLATDPSAYPSKYGRERRRDLNSGIATRCSSPLASSLFFSYSLTTSVHGNRNLKYFPNSFLGGRLPESPRFDAFAATNVSASFRWFNSR